MLEESIGEWSDLEHAVERQDWDVASRLAEEFDAQWREVRGLAEAFAGPGVDGWSCVLDDALEALLAALSIRPIPRAALEAAMLRMREILEEYGPRP
ncbi:MAG: hypothetical protein ACRBN8_46600 [Nannocystales bacterium]